MNPSGALLKYVFPRKSVKMSKIAAPNAAAVPDNGDPRSIQASGFKYADYIYRYTKPVRGSSSFLFVNGLFPTISVFVPCGRQNRFLRG